jgi:hypothetical protein
MGRNTLAIRSHRLGSISRGLYEITLRTTVDRGPISMIGRTSETFLQQSDIEFFLSTLATMPVYRNTFRAIANELDRRQEIVDNPDTRPNMRMMHSLDSSATTQAIFDAIQSAIIDV